MIFKQMYFEDEDGPKLLTSQQMITQRKNRSLAGIQTDTISNKQNQSNNKILLGNDNQDELDFIQNAIDLFEKTHNLKDYKKKIEKKLQFATKSNSVLNPAFEEKLEQVFIENQSEFLIKKYSSNISSDLFPNVIGENIGKLFAVKNEKISQNLNKIGAEKIKEILLKVSLIFFNWRNQEISQFDSGMFSNMNSKSDFVNSKIDFLRLVKDDTWKGVSEKKVRQIQKKNDERLVFELLEIADKKSDN